MKIKRTFLSIILAICLIVPICFAGCGKSEPTYAWGKYFRYEGNYYDYWGNYSTSSNGVDGSTVINLLKTEFANNNLELENATLNEEKIDLSSAKSGDELVQLIESMASQKFNAMLKDIKISIGTKESKFISINGTAYEFEGNLASGSNMFIKSNTDPDVYIGDFDPELIKNINNKDLGSECLSLSLFSTTSMTSINFRINTKTVVDDPTASQTIEDDIVVSTSILISFTAVFNQA